MMKEPSQPRLELALKAHLEPLLREDGFSGSGRNFRRVVDGWIQVVNVQGSRHSAQFAINLGMHPLSVVDSLGELPDRKTITEYQCAFRRRLSTNALDQWWAYGPSQESMSEAAQMAAAVYATAGRELFAAVSGPRSPFDEISPAAFAQSTESFAGFRSPQIVMALVLSRLRLAQGRKEESAGFADIGLSHISSATGLRAELERLSARE